MLLTAVKHDKGGQTCERIPFYAAIDTGAMRTLCSRDLAQKLFGHWNPDGNQQYRMFNGPFNGTGPLRDFAEFILLIGYYLYRGPDGRCFHAAWAVSKPVH